MQAAVGAQIGSYRIVDQLGEGGMGCVWVAMHTGLDKRVALKTLHADVAANPEAVARFLREGRAAARIRHPHIIGVTDVGLVDGLPYLVMDLCEGESLAALLGREGALTIETLVDVALPVADALHAAHLAGVVHRDLKPDNILLTRAHTGELHPVVLDFGISKVEDSRAQLTRTHAFMGTPSYMSPEQARGGKHVDGRSDQFSLGLILHECATGHRAVDGGAMLEIVHRIAQRDFPQLGALRPDLPETLLKVVGRMTEVEPATRFPTLREAGRALLPLASARTRTRWERAVQASAPPPPMSTPQLAARSSTTLSSAAGESIAPPLPRGRWGFAAAVAVLVAGLAIALGLAGGTERADTSAHSARVAAPSARAEAPVVAPASVARPNLRVRAVPATATIVIDDEQGEVGRLERALPQDGAEHRLHVMADGHIPRVIEVSRLPFDATVVLEPEESEAHERSGRGTAGDDASVRPGERTVSSDRSTRGTASDRRGPRAPAGSADRPPARAGTAAAADSRETSSTMAPVVGANGAVILR